MMMPWHWPHRIEKTQPQSSIATSMTSITTTTTGTDTTTSTYLFDLQGLRMHQREQREAAARLGEMLKDES